MDDHQWPQKITKQKQNKKRKKEKENRHLLVELDISRIVCVEMDSLYIIYELVYVNVGMDFVRYAVGVLKREFFSI